MAQLYARLRKSPRSRSPCANQALFASRRGRQHHLLHSPSASPLSKLHFFRNKGSKHKTSQECKQVKAPYLLWAHVQWIYPPFHIAVTLGQTLNKEHQVYCHQSCY
ncbi:hypothetical protein L1887_02021 [Cichorium endivia]|nr:hypothetical protein L1887_02021 [Cichorium endivia]